MTALWLFDQMIRTRQCVRLLLVGLISVLVLALTNLMSRHGAAGSAYECANPWMTDRGTYQCTTACPGGSS